MIVLGFSQGAEFPQRLSEADQRQIQYFFTVPFKVKELSSFIAERCSEEFLEIKPILESLQLGKNINILFLGVPKQELVSQEKLFYMSIQGENFDIQFLRTFISDTFDLLQNLDGRFLCMGNNSDSQNSEIIKIGSDGKILSVTNLGVGDFQVYPHEDDLFLGECKEGKFIVSCLNQNKGQFQHICEVPFLATQTRCPVVNEKMYIISSDNNDTYTIKTFKKNNDLYSLVPTNVVTEGAIAEFIPDSKDSAYILAFKTGYFSQYQWHYCDPDLKNKMDALSEKISLTLKPYYPYAWRFNEIPHSKNSGLSMVNYCGSISFDEYTIENDAAILCNDSGIMNIEELRNLIVLPFPQPKKITIEDDQGYPIDYGLFKSSDVNISAPTVMIIEGGPHVFIDHRQHADAIRFFNKNGYHVVIPQGLFRVGYSPSHVLKGQGEFGFLDIEHLRCVLRDLKNKSISSSLFVMGLSYGGYASARLSADSDLVKAAFVENALLDCTYEVFGPLESYFFSKSSEENANIIDQRKRERSPVLEAALPKVPVFVKSVKTDVRCPVEQSQKFVQGLIENNLPVVYLEAHLGGHEESFSNFQIIKDFFEGNYDVHDPYSLKDDYDLKCDTLGFFKH